MGRGRKRTNGVYRFFDIDESKNESTCTIEGCGKKFKGHHGTNLLSHLKVTHYNQYLTAKQITDEASTSNSTQCSKTAQVIDECVNLVTKHGRPFALIDDEAFQNILKITLGQENAAIISSRSIRDRIAAEAEEVRNEITAEIKDKLICLKVDAATCHDRAFLGINAQYILNNSILRTLAVVQLDRRHTSDFFKEKVISVLHRYRISLENLYSVTMDNGSNMIKMTKLLNEEVAQSHKEDEESHVHEDSDNLADFSLTDETFAEPISISAVRCAAHTLQLAIHDAFSSDNECKTILSDIRSCVRNLLFLSIFWRAQSASEYASI